jgi:hypothetical protein
VYVSLRHCCLVLTLMGSVILLGVSMNTHTQAADDAARSRVAVRGITGTTHAFTVDELKKLPRSEIETTDRKGKRVLYAGVAVAELLKKVEAPQGETLRGESLRAFVTVTARDEYRAVFALPEFDPDFTDRVIVLAYERDGEPLDLQTGPLQIIVPGEKKHARWVRMVNEIRVLDSAWIKE